MNERYASESDAIAAIPARVERYCSQYPGELADHMHGTDDVRDYYATQTPSGQWVIRRRPLVHGTCT